MDEQFDVVIIGSGGGGAPIAHILTKAGKRVLVIEKGPLYRPQADDPMGYSDYKREELISDGPEKRLTIPGLQNTGASFFTSHVEPDLNDEPHIYRNSDSADYATIEGYTCQCVGGGTQHYGGVSLRYSKIDFQLKSFNEGRTDIRNDPNGDVKREARDWPVAYDAFEKYYCVAEKLVGINGTRVNQIKPASVDNYLKPLEPNPISLIAKTGMDALGMKPYRTPQAIITEDHPPSGRKAGDPKTGYVNRYGDALDLKSSTWVSLLRPIRDEPNFTLWPNCVVTHLECVGDTVTRVNCRDPSGLKKAASGKVVVVACSAIESVRLLKISAEENPEFDKRINQNDLLGKYFLTHCFGGASAVMPGRFDKSVTIDSDFATDACGQDDFIRANNLWAGGTLYNNTSDQALPISLARTMGAMDLDTLWVAFTRSTSLTADALADWLRGNFMNRLSMSFMANQVPQKTNRIELHPRVRDKWNRKVGYIIKNWHPHDDYLMDVLADRCRAVLAYGGDGGKGQYPVEGFGGVYKSENALARIANHILGGARFGSDPRDSVLDPNCRAWNFKNLYVTDGSWMPTSGSGNPTLTIQANAFRVADYLKDSSGLL